MCSGCVLSLEGERSTNDLSHRHGHAVLYVERRGVFASPVCDLLPGLLRTLGRSRQCLDGGSLTGEIDEDFGDRVVCLRPSRVMQRKHAAIDYYLSIVVWRLRGARDPRDSRLRFVHCRVV